MKSVSSSPVRIVTVDHLRLTRRSVLAKPMPRRRGLRSLAWVLPVFPVDEGEESRGDGYSPREWFERMLAAQKVSRRQRTIVRRLLDGEPTREAARKSRVSAQFVQQVGDALARQYDPTLRTGGQLVRLFSLERRELLRERAKVTVPADFHAVPNADR